ncbi:CDP-glycerol glycerophosphotransferase family protein [Aureimonas psammosilenae]|uniref:CDP-glycerol glycerophosphotransferase family protein n=1 Tax=Aureimonas psammosilenae TaxID=2495496 RepID=UPI001260C48C|nr:CDP-glycerol glycerophosphotransferase family protein [Aureimonas psammosilenae]
MKLRDLPKAAKVYAKLLPFRLSGRLPSRRDLWLFHGAFEGNTKYLFLWLSLHRPDIRAVWLSSSRQTTRRLRRHGLAAETFPSGKAIELVARAGFHFVNDYGKKIPFRSSRSFLVSLWHGVGIKNIGIHREKNSGALYVDSIFRPNFLVASSRRHAERFANSFSLPLENCPILGTPRLDAAFDPMLKDKLADLDGQSNPDPFRDLTYLYVPTLRAGNRPFLREALPDLPRLDAILRERGATLYVKLHPKTLRLGQDGDHLQQLVHGLDRVRVWPEDVDLYGVLHSIDFLITDYSSTFADFLFAKPAGLILYPFDKARYEGADRSFHVPYELIEGERADDFDSLCRIVATGCGASIDNVSACARTRREFWDDNAGISSPRIVAFFENLDPQEQPGLAPFSANRPYPAPGR